MSRHRGGLVAVASVAALLVAACQSGPTAAGPSLGSPPVAAIATPDVSPTGTLFRAMMLAPAQYASVPLVFGDETGLVTAIEQQPLAGGFDPGTRVSADPTNATVLSVSWLGGACDTEIDISFARASSGYALEIQSHRGAGTCPAVGIPRGLEIDLSAPVRPALIVASGD